MEKKIEQFTELQIRLINAVKKYPELYSRNNPKKISMLSWDQVAAEVGEPVKLCKSKWKTLRDKRTKAVKRHLITGEKSRYLESSLLGFLSSYGELHNFDDLSDTAAIESEDDSDLEDKTILTQDMIESMLKKKEKEQSTGVDVKDINVQSIVNGVINNFESLLLRKQIDVMTKAPVIANVSNIVEVIAPSNEPVVVFVVDDGNNKNSNSKIVSSEDTNDISSPKSNFKAAESNDGSAPQVKVELESTAATFSHGSGNEIEILQPQVTSFNNDSSLSTITQILPTIQNCYTLQGTNVTTASTSSLDVAPRNQSLSQSQFIKYLDNIEPLRKLELKSRKRKYSDSSSSSGCSKTGASPDKEKSVSILDVDCNEKNMNTFFNNLANYITGRFSEDKQMEIRLRICSMLTHAEMEELKPNNDD